MPSVGRVIGGYRRWFSADPPGKSSGRLSEKLRPACTSRTPCSTFSWVMRLMRPSSSSSPQSPHVEPPGRCTHRFAMCKSSCSGVAPSHPADVQLEHDRHQRDPRVSSAVAERSQGTAIAVSGLTAARLQCVKLAPEVDERHLFADGDLLDLAHQ